MAQVRHPLCLQANSGILAANVLSATKAYTKATFPKSNGACERLICQLKMTIIPNFAGTVMTETPTRHCFAVLVDNEPGVLARVVGLFSGRGYNIESLTVDEVDLADKLSRITIVTSGTPMVIEQIAAQLGRLIPVRQVINLTASGRFIESCVAFIKLIGDPETVHADAKLIARKFGARVVDETDNAIIFEITSDFDQIARALSMR